MSDKYVSKTGLTYYHGRISNLFARQDALDTLSDRVDDIVSEGGEPNTIETISVNGTNVPPDAQKNVALTIPTAGSAQDTSGYATYGELTTGLAGKANASDVPAKTSDLTNDGDGTSNYATESYVANNGGKINKIKRNGVELTIDSTDKSVNVLVPDTAATTASDGLMSASDKTKLDGIAAGAEVNVQADWLEASSSSDAYIANKPTKLSDFTNDGDGTQGSTFPTTAEMNSAISSAITSAYIYKGSVATVYDLPSTGNTPGDVYDVQSSGINYAWTGSTWDALGQLIDTTLLWAKADLTAVTTAEIDTIIDGE